LRKSTISGKAMGCLNALLAGRLARNESYDAPFGIPCRLLTPYLLDDDDNDVSDKWLVVGDAP